MIGEEKDNDTIVLFGIEQYSLDFWEEKGYLLSYFKANSLDLICKVCPKK